MFDLAQTFYVDQRAVANSDTVFITSVELYFRDKPVQSKTKTGIDSPGVSVYIAPVDLDGPNVTQVFHLFAARMEYAQINTDITGTTSTKFTFRTPVPVSTDASYALLIRFDGSDTDFTLWYNKAGNLKQGATTTSQVSSGKNDGYFYKVSMGEVLTPEKDADLKFKVNIAKFSSLSSVFKITNRNIEILNTNTANGTFFGGEKVWQMRANNTGTVSVNNTSNSVTGTGTSFSSLYTVGDYFVITDGTLGNADVRQITAITNNTVLATDLAMTFTNTAAQHIKTVTGKAYLQDGISDQFLIIDSTSNTSVFLSTNTVIAGIDSLATANVAAIRDYSVNAVIPNFAVQLPAATSASLVSNFANAGHSIVNSTAFSTLLAQRELVITYDAVASSRTSEVTAGTPFKSYQGSLTFTSSNPYSSPWVREENLDMFIERYSINNDTTNENIGQGNAFSKYISKTIVLIDGQHAEDIHIILSAWKPSNTSLVVYAKVRNNDDPESFDLKNWSLLTQTTMPATSNRNNPKDFINIEFGFPAVKTGVTAVGTFTVNSTAVILGTSGAVNTDIATGTLVRVYSPSVNSTFFYDTVITSNSTTFTVAGTMTANASLQQTGMLVDVITDKNSVFLNNQNQNISRYMSRSGAFFDAYDAFAIKIVPLSTDGVSVPFVDDCRAIAVTA